jgi:RimJ/RimL family protein N-acetyltransferase
VLVADEGGDVVAFTDRAAFVAQLNGGQPLHGRAHDPDPSHWGRGVGRTLRSAQLDRARDAGIHVMVGVIDGGNQALL